MALQQASEMLNPTVKAHAGLFFNVADALKKGGKADYCICGVCGNTVENACLRKCPISGSPKSKIFQSSIV
jgi:rubrerythrin